MKRITKLAFALALIFTGRLPAQEAPVVLPGDPQINGSQLKPGRWIMEMRMSRPGAPDAVPAGDARLPVMVWIHGGGNTIGSSEVYDGGRLASQHGLVVVTVNYRMGVFGWFTHPALREGETRYFVVSTWADEESYQAWRTGQAGAHHGGSNPVATGAELLEFEVVALDQSTD